MDILRMQSVYFSLIILSCLQKSHMRAISGSLEGGVSRKHLSENRSKKPNSIKCVISKKSKF